MVNDGVGLGGGGGGTHLKATDKERGCDPSI